LLLAVAVLGVAGLLNLVKGLDVEEALACWALAGGLWWARGAFVVLHDPGFARALRMAPAFVAFTCAVSVLAVWAAAAPGQHADVIDGASRLMMLLPAHVAFRAHFGWLPTGVAILSIGTLVAIAWLVFRPLAPPVRRTGADRDDAERLIRLHGTDTLSFFKLRRDKHYFFTRDGRAFAGYRIENGAMVLSGDPVGPPDALPQLAREVRGFAQTRGLRVAVLGASESALELWRAQGLRSFYIGDEALVDTASFSLEGRAIRKIRQSVTRMCKAGFEAEVRRLGDLDEAQVRELVDISDRWRAGEPERGFSMAMDTLQGEHLSDSVVLVARDGDGVVRGFLHFVPVFGRAAMSLSFMRRDRETPNGLTEFMVVRAIEQLGERGVEELSLNFAAFARWMHAPSGPLERALGKLASVFNPYFQIESLYRFNAKFFPRWEPRYLLFESALGLPRVALAAVWLEGQLPKPRLGTRGDA
jgi:lysyl-tRNA synthetase class 2